MRFVDNAKRFSLISVSIVVIAIIVGIINGGLNLGLDFTGGSILTLELNEVYELSDINAALEANDIDPNTAQIVRSEDTKAIIRIQRNLDDETVRDGIVGYLTEKYPEASSSDIERVGGATTSDIIQNAFLSVLIAAGLMLIYIWIRFELFSGMAAVVALFHDVIIMTAVVCILRIQINSSYIAACLTIVGYSINDTIVIFDRIRENNKKYPTQKMSRSVVDLSIRETLPRTLNTSLTTLVTITAVYIFGVQSIKEFALPIIVGLVAGTCSSIFIAGPLWIWLLERKQERHASKNSKTKKAAKKA